MFEKNDNGLMEKLEEIAGSLHEQNPMFTSSFIIPPPCISFEARGTITTPRLISLLTSFIVGTSFVKKVERAGFVGSGREILLSMTSREEKREIYFR